MWSFIRQIDDIESLRNDLQSKLAIKNKLQSDGRPTNECESAFTNKFEKLTQLLEDFNQFLQTSTLSELQKSKGSKRLEGFYTDLKMLESNFYSSENRTELSAPANYEDLIISSLATLKATSKQINRELGVHNNLLETTIHRSTVQASFITKLNDRVYTMGNGLSTSCLIITIVAEILIIFAIIIVL